MLQRREPRQFDEAVKSQSTHQVRHSSHSIAKGPPQFPAPHPRSAPAASKLEVESDPHISEQLYCIITQEVRLECAKCFHRATEQAVANALLDLLITSTTKVKKKRRNALYLYIETKLRTSVEKGT